MSFSGNLRTQDEHRGRTRRSHRSSFRSRPYQSHPGWHEATSKGPIYPQGLNHLSQPCGTALQPYVSITWSSHSSWLTVFFVAARYWKDPHAFKPDRFLAPDWPRDAFLPFSAGARGCIGRKFAEVTAVLALTVIVRRYKLTIDPSAEKAGESKEERIHRLLRANLEISLMPERIPLVLTRR